MKSRQPLGKAVQIAVGAIIALGMIGGTLIVAHSGFNTSPKRGGTPILVPAPQAYILAATMFGMSVIGWIALIWEARRSMALTALSVLLYIFVAVLIISRLQQ